MPNGASRRKLSSVYVRMYVGYDVHVGLCGQLLRTGFLVPPCGLQGSKAGRLAWQQASLPL